METSEEILVRYDWWDKITQRAGFLLFIYLCGSWKLSPLWVTILTGVAMYHHWRQQKALEANAAVQFERQMQKQVEFSKIMTIAPSWINFSDSERVVWLNRTVAAIWPYAKKATEASIKGSLEGIFVSMKPKFLSKLGFSQLDMGPLPPNITGVRVVQDAKIKEGVVLDMDLLMNSKTDVQLEASSGPVGLCVKVADLLLQATMRVVLRPLQDNWPCFSAITIAFTSKPRLQFTLQAAKVPLSSIPGFQPWLETFLRDTLSYYLVLPKRLVIPLVTLSPEALEELHDEPAEGMLTVQLHRGSNLTNLDTFSKSDPYVEFLLGDECQRSTTIEDNLNPIWASDGRSPPTFSWVVYEPKVEVLRVRVWDEEKVGASRPLGDCEMPLSNLAPNISQQQWASLSHTTTGQLELTLTWQPFTMVTLPGGRGALFVRLHRCVGLPNVESGKNNCSDPYVELTVGGVTQRTAVQQNTLNPVFEQRFKFLLLEPDTKRELTLRVWDYEKVSAPRLLGEAVVEFDSPGATGKVSKKQCQLRGKGRAGGHVELSFEYRSVAPLPDRVLRKNNTGMGTVHVHGTATVQLRGIFDKVAEEPVPPTLIGGLVNVKPSGGTKREKDKPLKYKAGEWEKVTVACTSAERVLVTLKAKKETLVPIEIEAANLKGNFSDQEFSLDKFTVGLSANWVPETRKDK